MLQKGRIRGKTTDFTTDGKDAKNGAIARKMKETDTKKSPRKIRGAVKKRSHFVYIFGAIQKNPHQK